ncbi:hypothetical protein GCM10008986_35060 [Salinibacillus aidingensis]|uniref:Glutaredoxin domain-containing protein n=1 Tax=Salinibacillus aidingensis TaxID=237684 RepID=A0ABN1BSP0_9BACI
MFKISGDVTVYTNPNCGFCHKQINWMKNNGIEFNEKNIKENEQYRSEFFNLGGRGTPFSIIKTDSGYEHIRGFNIQMLTDLLL